MITHSEAPSMRELLARNPLSFNELLDMFEPYVATVSPPLFKAHDLIEEQCDYRQGEIFTQIFAVCDTDLIARKLKQVRASRNADGEVMVSLTRFDAKMVESAIREASRTISDATTVLGGLCRRAGRHDTPESVEAIALMSLTHRALGSSEDAEFVRLLGFASKIEAARKYGQVEEEEAA
ncbi:hypothetical protein [Cypionkella sp. TWP1-2-1b2]|uniref:hypothetical protein n=1 Tax=Cypionkella sp. TWP1-2-1b2 TaxID=2804675 RepID=UPI003CE95804